MAQPKLRSAVVAPPIKGWNVKDSVVTMDPEFAITLENMYPRATSLDLRKGFTLLAQNMASNVAGDVIKTLAAYGDSFLIAGSYASGGNKWYKITSAGVVTDITGAAIMLTCSANTLMFNDVLFIKTLEEGESVYSWNGAGNIALAGFTGPGHLGGDNNTVAITSYKGRIYLGQWDPQQIWYGGVGAITGATTAFDLRTIFQRKGHITILGRISRAKNYIEDSILIIINDVGEVLAYQGEYPGSPTWGLLGQYSIAPPLGPRAFCYSGSDMLIMTTVGIISLNAVMSGESGFAAGSSISQNISQIWPTLDATSTNSDFYGAYTLVEYPQGGQLVANIPQTTNVTSNQFVMNTATGAWCRFVGQNAFSWAVFKNQLYFGGTNGKVFHADSGDADISPTDGTIVPRYIQMRPAYNYLGNPLTVKQFTEAKPYLSQSGGLSITMDADVDYANNAPTNSVTDASDLSYKLYRPNITLNGIGKAISLRFDQGFADVKLSYTAVEIFWNEGEIR